MSETYTLKLEIERLKRDLELQKVHNTVLKNEIRHIKEYLFELKGDIVSR